MKNELEKFKKESDYSFKEYSDEIQKNFEEFKERMEKIKLLEIK